VELYLHSQYAFMVWCSVKAQGQLYFTVEGHIGPNESPVKNGGLKRVCREKPVAAPVIIPPNAWRVGGKEENQEKHQ
jgi:hypothetical protein